MAEDHAVHGGDEHDDQRQQQVAPPVVRGSHTSDENGEAHETRECQRHRARAQDGGPEGRMKQSSLKRRGEIAVESPEIRELDDRAPECETWMLAHERDGLLTRPTLLPPFSPFAAA